MDKPDKDELREMCGLMHESGALKVVRYLTGQTLHEFMQDLLNGPAKGPEAKDKVFADKLHYEGAKAFASALVQQIEQLAEEDTRATK